MKLYSYFRSSSSYRVRIALEHKGIPYEYIPVHLLKDGGEQHLKDYSKLNPKNEVPLLQDENLTLAQSVAIFFYLDRIKVGSPLFPKEQPFFEKCLELVEIINSGTQPLQNLAVLKKLTNDLKISEEQKLEWIQFYIRKGLQAYSDSLYYKDTFSMGAEVTAADMFLVPQIYNAKRFNVDFTGLENLLEIEARCLELPSFIKAHPDNQPDAPKD